MSNTFHYATRHQREMNSNTSMPCFHQDFLVFSLSQKFSIIPEWHGSRTRRCASSLIVAEMCGNINTNESASSNAGRIGHMLIQLQLLSSIRRSFSLPCSAAMFLQTAKARERCVWCLSFAFSAFTGYAPLDYCIYACVMVVIDSLKLWSKNPSFFQKILGPLILIGTHFPMFFCSILPPFYW